MLRRERIATPDGDFLDLDWAVVPGLAPAARPGGTMPLTLVLHGLEGSARSRYALETYRQLAARGVEAVGLNFRSCSGELNRRPRLYHSGETEDLRFVLGLLRSRFRGRPIGAIGFSLGGNVLLKYLGEEGRVGHESRVIPSAAAAVSVPFDLSAGADRLERGLSRAYMWRLLRQLERKIRGKRAMLRELIDVETALRARTFRAFDDAATAPLHGFRDAEDYYERCGSKRFLHAIRIPTLLVQAEDDPFMPRSAIPRETIVANPALDPVITRRGGHVGFLAGTPWAPVFWAEARAAEFVSQHLTARSVLAAAGAAGAGAALVRP